MTVKIVKSFDTVIATEIITTLT